MPKPKLLVVIASTRPGRIGRPIGDWFNDVARQHDGFEIAEADLAEINLPLLDEPNHPRFRNYTKDHTKAWSETVDAADAFVFVMPEYNHSFPASIKNAVDYLNQEWKYKPLGFVSYGGIAAGTRSVQAFKPVASALVMTVPHVLVNIAWVGKQMHDGKFVADDSVNTVANDMLDELLHLHSGLSVVRDTAA